MCGIVGFWDKTGQRAQPTGTVILSMLDALACRGPDGAGVAIIGDEPATGAQNAWWLRIAPGSREAIDRLSSLGHLVDLTDPHERDRSGHTHRFAFEPNAGVSALGIERALGEKTPVEVLCLGSRLDLVKQVGSPRELEAAYAISRFRGPLGIGHTRMSTESRIDLSHSQPFWAHGIPDLATVHNGHITNYHQLRRRYEQEGVVFYTENDSEVIGVYLRKQLEAGATLEQALESSMDDLDGAFNYLVASPEGLGIARDRHGFKPLVVAETDEWLAIATEEIAIRRALPGRYRVCEPPPGCALFYRAGDLVLAGA